MAASAHHEYLNDGEPCLSSGNTELNPATCSFRRKVAAALFSTGLVLCATAACLGRWRRSAALRGEFSDTLGAYGMSKLGQYDESKYPSQCGKLEENTDYIIDDDTAWGQSMDHIPSADMCCSFCHREPKCKSFVWVEDAGLEGCPSQCWLKGAKPDAKKKKKGVIAGIPPGRPKYLMAPQMSSPDRFQANNGIFCFSLMLPFGYEPALIAWQFKNQASIFACDKYAVYTNKSMEIVPGLFTRVVDSNLHCGTGGDSNSALNSWIFIAVWKKVLDDGYWLEYPWTVKADPDCVFFPGRLRRILPQYTGEPYINNCHYGMHGPLEVLGQPALKALQADYRSSEDGKAPKRCVSEQHFGQWGEDMFLSQCFLKILRITNGVPPALEPKLMCEDHCDCDQYYWCNNGTDRVSFHPFKSVGAYQNCVAMAAAAGSLL